MRGGLVRARVDRPRAILERKATVRAHIAKTRTATSRFAASRIVKSKVGSWGLTWMALLVLLVWDDAAAQRRERPIRVGNTSLLVVGGGYASHDHPTFDRHAFINLGYQFRILRRETRWVPIWARGAVNFSSKDEDFADAYTVWPGNDLENGINLGPDPLVQERTSDFAVRAEVLADVIRVPYAALYGGVGFAVHIVNFTTRGTESQTSFDDTSSELGPSAVAGGRIFLTKQPYAAYGEVRFGRVFGRTEYPVGRPLSSEDFEFVGKNVVSFEAGLGLHW